MTMEQLIEQHGESAVNEALEDYRKYTIHLVFNGGGQIVFRSNEFSISDDRITWTGSIPEVLKIDPSGVVAATARHNDKVRHVQEHFDFGGGW